MKKYLIILVISLFMMSCGSQVYVEPAALSSAIARKEFNFNATNAYPTSGDVIGVMNAMPGAMASRMLRLDPGYGFNLKRFVKCLPALLWKSLYSKSGRCNQWWIEV